MGSRAGISVLYEECLDSVAFIANRVWRFCAARILGILARWTKWKREKGHDDWVYMPMIPSQRVEVDVDGKRATSWYGEMLGEYGKDAIRNALAILVEHRMIDRRKNPYNGQDKTYQYRLLSFVPVCELSEGEISQLEFDYSPSSQRSNPLSTQLERSALTKELEADREQENQLKTPQKSIGEEGKNSSNIASQDQSSAAPADRDFLTQNWAAFEPPDAEDSGLVAKFFDWVLRSRVPQLPTQPAHPRSVATGWIRKHGRQLAIDFLKWRRREVESQPPPPPPVEECQQTPAQLLRKYQGFWQTPNMRHMVQRFVQQHPEWGIEIGPNGPQWKEGDPCLATT